MKNYIFIVLLVVVSAFAKAQNITNAEYFIDTDPGVGQGTALAINTTGNDITDSFTVNIGNLPIGFHRLYTRVQDANGAWSHYDKFLFYVADTTPLSNPALPNITDLEYFIDTDPGVGMATSVAINNVGQDITDTFTLNIGTLPQGFHRMYTRVKDANNTWSLYDKFLFYVADPTPITNPTLPTIVAAEYFLGTDPGFGNAMAITLGTPGTNDSFMFDIDFSSLPGCSTTPFHLRVQDANGTWSLYDFDPALEISGRTAPTVDVSTLADVTGTCEVLTITAPTATDACTSAAITGTSDAAFPITANTTVTWTYDDGNGNTSTQAQNVVIADTVDPVAAGMDITIDLAGNNSVSIIGSDIDNGSNDNCSTVNLTAMPDTFTATGVYTVTLTATDVTGNTGTTTVQVTVDDTLSNESVALENLVKIYPNPTNAVLLIESEVELQQIELFDLTGKRLFVVKKELDKINLQDLSQGVYLIKLTSTKGNLLTRRVIKN